MNRIDFQLNEKVLMSQELKRKILELFKTNKDKFIRILVELSKSGEQK